MSKFRINCCFQVILPGTGDAPYYRLVWKSERTDEAWVIQIPEFGSDYCKAPFITALSMLAVMEEACELVLVEMSLNPLWDESDEVLRQRYSDKAGRCRLLDARDMRWGWIQGLVTQHSLADIFEGNLIPGWVNQRARELHKSRAKIYNAIYSYFAGGSRKNALYYRWPKSGGKGNAREQKKKLGRPDAEAAADKSVSRGYHLSELDKRKIRFAWRHFLKGKAVRKAFREMAAVFYRAGVKTVNGKSIAILLPARQRPTLRQFVYWGPRNDPSLSAWRVKLAPREWWNNHRGLPGTAKDGVVAVGQMAFCDSTTNDAHLVSVASRLKPVGPLHRLLIHEAISELIIGMHCGFEPPSARTFLMAVANAASSKVSFFARFGIAVTEDQAPAIAVKTYLVDNGEARNEASIEALSQFGAIIDLAKSGASSSKGPIEALHHTFHARLDHELDGTTHGRRRRRGEPDPVLQACLNYYEYMHELLNEVLYYNTKEPVPHLLTLEMRRDNVNPTRIEIFHWLVKKGYVVDFTPDVSVLRAHLLPKLPAVLDETGIHLLREDRGDKMERVKGLRYMADYLIKACLLDDARRNGVRRVTVRGVPENPEKMWLVTESGLVELRCVADPLLIRQGTVQDCIAIQDDDHLKSIQTRDESDQARVDIEAAREQNVRAARNEKQQALDALPRKPSKKELASGIAENRRAEMRLIDDGAGDKAEVPPNTNENNTPPSNGSESNTTSISSESPAQQALQAFLNQRRQA